MKTSKDLVLQLLRILEQLGQHASDWLSWFVGTWRFIFCFSFVTLSWILLHQHGILHIDGPDFAKWNLLLGYFAGTQASIILMSSSRQAVKDRKKQEAAVKLQQKKLDLLIQHIEALEEIIEALAHDKGDPHE